MLRGRLKGHRSTMRYPHPRTRTGRPAGANCPHARSNTNAEQPIRLPCHKTGISQNRQFWLGLVGALGTRVMALANALGAGECASPLVEAIECTATAVLAMLATLGVVVDPTTEGMGTCSPRRARRPLRGVGDTSSAARSEGCGWEPPTQVSRHSPRRPASPPTWTEGWSPRGRKPKASPHRLYAVPTAPMLYRGVLRGII